MRGRELPDPVDVIWLRDQTIGDLRELLIGRLEVGRRARYKNEGPSDDDLLFAETLVKLIDERSELKR